MQSYTRTILTTDKTTGYNLVCSDIAYILYLYVSYDKDDTYVLLSRVLNPGQPKTCTLQITYATVDISESVKNKRYNPNRILGDIGAGLDAGASRIAVILEVYRSNFIQKTNNVCAVNLYIRDIKALTQLLEICIRFQNFRR